MSTIDTTPPRAPLILVGLVVLLVLSPLSVFTSSVDASDPEVLVENPDRDNVDGDGRTGSAETRDGDDVYGSVQAGIDAAAVGNRVSVTPGTYRSENVTIEKDVTVAVSTEPGAARLLGSGSDFSVGIAVQGDAAPVFDGLRFENYQVGIGLSDEAGSTVRNSGFVDVALGVDARGTDSAWTVAGSQFVDVPFGVVASNATGAWTVRDTQFRGGVTGVFAPNTTGTWTVTGSLFRDGDDDGIVADGSVAGWTVAETRFVNVSDGVQAWSSRGAWTVRNSSFVDVRDDGVDAYRSSGEWTVRGVEFEAVDSDAVSAVDSTGDWRVVGATVTGAAGEGVAAYGSTGDWIVRNYEARGLTPTNASFGAGVDAFRSSGNWTVANATVEDSNQGVIATGAVGNWGLYDSTIRTADAGVLAGNTSGTWTVRGSRIEDVAVGVFAPLSSGPWTVEQSVVRNATTDREFAFDAATSPQAAAVGGTGRPIGTGDGAGAPRTTGGAGGVVDAAAVEFPGEGTGVYVANTTGNWSIHRSTIAANAVHGINATGATPAGDATRNYWGRAGGPRVDQCVGNVDCGQHLAGPPAGAGPGEDEPTGTLSVTVRDATNAPVTTAEDGVGVRIRRLDDGSLVRGGDVNATTFGLDADGKVSVSVTAGRSYRVEVVVVDPADAAAAGLTAVGATSSPVAVEADGSSSVSLVVERDSRGDGGNGRLAVELPSTTVQVPAGGRGQFPITLENRGDGPLSNVRVRLTDEAGDDMAIRTGSSAGGDWRGAIPTVWRLDRLGAGERVQPSATVETSPVGALQQGFGDRPVDLAVFADGERVLRRTVTVEIVEPESEPDIGLDVAPGLAAGAEEFGVASPGQTIGVGFQVVNRQATSVGAAVAVTSLGPLSISSYEADVGRWSEATTSWSVTGLEAAGEATPRLLLKIPPDAEPGRYPVGARVVSGGQTVARDSATIRVVPDRDGDGAPDTNRAPTAAISVNATNDGGTVVVPRGTTLRFDASASRDPDGEVAAYRWDIDGDGTPEENGPVVRRRFDATGPREVTLTVDDGVATDAASVVVNVTAPGDDGDDAGGSDGPTNQPEVVPGNIAPKAEFDGPSGTRETGRTLRFDATDAVDPDGEIVTLAWDFDGDDVAEVTKGSALGRPSFTATYAYDSPGEYPVSLTVIDDAGVPDTVTRTIEVFPSGTSPLAVFEVQPEDESAEGTTITGGTVGFDASSSQPGRSADRIVSYEWSFGDGTTRSGVAPDAVTVAHTYDEPGTYTVTLTATDSRGRRAVAERTVEVAPPEKPEITVRSQLPGRLIKGYGITNRYFVDVTSQAPVESVRLELPDGEVIEANEVDVPRLGTGWVVPVNVDEIPTDGPQGLTELTVVAVDDRGVTGRTTVGVDVVEPPSWYDTLLGPDPEVTKQNGRWVLRGQPRIFGDRSTRTVDHDFVFSPTEPLRPKEAYIRYEIGVSTTHFFETGRTYFNTSLSKPRAEYSGAEKAAVELLALPRGSARGESGGSVLLGDTTEDVEFGGYESRFRLEADIPGIPVVGSKKITLPKVGEVEVDTVSLNVKLDIAGRLQIRRTRDDEFGVRLDGTIEATGKPKLGPQVGVRNIGVGLYVFGEVSGTVEPQVIPCRPAELRLGLDEVGVGGRVLVVSREAEVPLSGELAVEIPCSDPVLLSQSNSAGDASLPTRGATDLARRPGRGVVESTGSSVRLSDLETDGFAPSVARTTGGAVAVWTARDPAESADTGADLYLAERSDGTWGDPRRITDDDRLDVQPTVATADDDRLLAWVRGDGPGTDGATLDVVVRPPGATEPVRITDGAALDLAPVAAGLDGPDGPRWLVAWTRDGDGNLTTTDDRAVRYALLDAEGAVRDSGRVGGGGVAAVAGGRGTFTLGVVAGDAPGTTVTRLGIGPDGNVTGRRTFEAPNATSVAAATDAVGWVRNDPGGQRAVVVDGPDRMVVPLGNATRVGDLELTRAPGPLTAVYRAELPGQAGPTVAYQVRTGPGWTTPRAFGLAPGLSATDLDVAGTGGTDLVAVTATRDGDSARTDVYAVNRTVGPDLVASATASVDDPVRVGAPTTVNYAVRNVGGRPTDATTLALVNRTGTVATARVSALDPGERASGNLTVPLGRSGAVRVVADAGDDVAESDESNNDAVAVGARPDLEVAAVTDRLRGDRLRVEVRLRNDGPVPATGVAYRVRAGNETRTASVGGIGAGRNLTAAVEFPADTVGTAAPVTVRVDPDDRVAESDETDNGLSGRVRRLDLEAPNPGSVTLGTAGDSTATPVSFTLRNTDTGTGTALVSVTAGDVGARYPVSVPAARGPDDVAAVPVTLWLPGDVDAEPGAELAISSTPGGGADADADVTDNVIRTTVGEANAAPADATSLSVVDATLSTGTDRNATVDVALRNPGTVTVGEVVRVSRGADGPVVASRPVTVPPDATETVRVRLPALPGGNLTVVTATNTAVVDGDAGPVERADTNGDGVISTEELREAIQRWALGEIDTEALRAVIRAWATGG